MSLTPLLEESMRELPGRFPLYAPSVTSITDRAVRELRPRTPRLTAIGTGPSQGDFTAPASACRRPRFSGAQSDLLPQRRRRQRSLPDRQADPYYTPTGSRPFETRRAVSDTRYNSNRRDLPADHGSPIRIIRRKCQLPSRYTNQPENDQGLDSDASPPPSPVSAQRVHNELRTCLTKDLTPDSRAGVVYILRAENSRLLKIGSTMNFKRRLQELQRDYGRKLETVLVSEFLENYARVEKLAQADLWHLCRPFKCPCATEHREWHEVDETVAINTVQRWVDFMREQQPYDETSGKLKHIWKHLLSKSRLATTRDHEVRWEQWARIVDCPTRVEHLKYRVEWLRRHGIWMHAWVYVWQVFCVLLCTLVFLLLRSPSVFFLLVTTTACAYWSMVGDKRISR